HERERAQPELADRVLTSPEGRLEIRLRRWAPAQGKKGNSPRGVHATDVRRRSSARCQRGEHWQRIGRAALVDGENRAVPRGHLSGFRVRELRGDFAELRSRRLRIAGIRRELGREKQRLAGVRIRGRELGEGGEALSRLIRSAATILRPP